jgi:hypothetical protein
MNNNDMDNRISTSDFTLVASLKSLGYHYSSLDKTNKKRVVFYYDRTVTLEETIQMYFRKEIRIIPQDLVDAQKDIRSQIFTDL